MDFKGQFDRKDRMEWVTINLSILDFKVQGTKGSETELETYKSIHIGF